ncbi:glycosyltransferase family 2 protein [Acetobacter fallax]|nr:glycosyltransferase family 2 protein [Acetobacter fallax]
MSSLPVMDMIFILRIFRTGLGRSPDSVELNRFKALSQRLSGESFGRSFIRNAVADAVIALPEFRKLHGAGTGCSDTFLHAMVYNATGRGPTSVEYAALKTTRDRAAALILAADLLRDFDPFDMFYPAGASPDDNLAYGLWARWYDIFSRAERQVALPCGISGQADWPGIALLIEVSCVRPDLLEETIRSLTEQSYDGWSAYIAGTDLSSQVMQIMDRYNETSQKIHFCKVGKGESLQATVYAASREPYVAFLNPGDELAQDALFRIARALAAAPDTALLYTDEDVMGEGGWYRDARLKPGWSDDQLLAGDTVGQLAVFSRKRIEEIGGFAAATRHAGKSGQQAVSGSMSHYALKLTIAEGLTSERIQHLADLLFHRRRGPDDLSFMAKRASAAVQHPPEHYIAASHLAHHRPDLRLTEAKLNACVSDRSDTSDPGPLWPRVLYPLPARYPTVSVIIPTRDRPDLLSKCVTGLLEQTDYHALDVVIVDNGSIGEETLHLFRQLETDTRVTIRHFDFPFNWSRLNNEAIRTVRSDLVLLLNDDIEILHPEWLEEMVRQIMRPNVGIVGAKLLYPDTSLQHGGVVLSEDGVTHILRGASPEDPGYLGQLAWQRDLLAVTGACLLIRRDVYNRVGGLDASFRVTCNDIDLCLRVVNAGWRVVWTPHAVLTHLDGATRGRDVSVDRLWQHCSETARLVGRWQQVMASDPAVNPALRTTDHHLLLAWPPPPRPL